MKKLSKTAILFFLCMFAFTAYSQRSLLPGTSPLLLEKPVRNWNDWNQHLLRTDSLDINNSGSCWRNTRFILPFDGRFSRMSDPLGGASGWVKIFGFKIGLEFYEKFRFGLGFYAQENPLAGNIIQNEGEDTLSYSIGFAYNTFFAEYIFYKDFRWEFSIPGQIGKGRIPVKLFSFGSDSMLYDSTFTIPVASFGIAAHYKFFPWFGIGAGIGYRQILIKDDIINQSFSKPFFAIKLKLFLGPLYKCIFKPDVIKAQREEYNRMRRKKREARESKREKKQTQSDEQG